MAESSSTKAKWSRVFRSTVQIVFEEDPDVHTYLQMAPTGQKTDFIRTAIRHYIKATGHPAANPETQREVFLQGCPVFGDGVPVAETMLTKSSPAKVGRATREDKTPPLSVQAASGSIDESTTLRHAPLEVIGTSPKALTGATGTTVDAAPANSSSEVSEHRPVPKLIQAWIDA